LLVTHFMDEAEHLCDRLAVVDKGRISAIGSPQQLIARYAPEIKISFSYLGDNLDWLERTPDVSSVSRRAGLVEVRGGDAVIVRVAAALAAQGLAPRDFRVEQPSLDDVFLEITGASQ
jgi:ABC-2 type transport system ATP-binding protein